jgi:hypothetical protein
MSRSGCSGVSATAARTRGPTWAPLPASSIPRVFVVPKVMNVLGHPCAKPPELLAHLVKLFVPAERSSITDRANHRD